MDEIKPAGIPAPILKNPRAINLYMVAVIVSGAFPLIVIVGAIVLAFFEKTMPPEVWPLAGTALATLGLLIYGERNAGQ